MSLRENIASSADGTITGSLPVAPPYSGTERVKPSIVHVITELGSGGAERMLQRLVSASKRYRHVVVSLTTEGKLGASMRHAGVEVFALGMSRDFPSPAAIFRLAHILRRERPVIVQTWLYHADLIGLIAARVAGIRTVAWNLRCSNLDLSQYRWTTRVVVRLLVWLSAVPAAIMANSDAGRRWHNILGYRPNRWEIVPNGIDTQFFHPDSEARARWRRQFNVGKNDVLVGMVARRDPSKHHENLLRAAAELTRQRSDLAFVFAGRGVSRNDAVLAHLADAVHAPVHLIGESDDVAGLTAALDVAVLASVGEGFPNVVTEAMATGVPCIATDSGDVATILGGTGLVVPPGDENALTAAISSLASDSAMRARMGEAARHRIEEHYSLAAAVDRYETIWQQLATVEQAEQDTEQPRTQRSLPKPKDQLTVQPAVQERRLFQKALRRGLPILVTVAALAAVLSRFDLHNLWNTATTLRPSALAVVVSALLVGNLLACVRFKIIAGDLHQPMRLRDAFAATSLGQLAGSFFFQVVGQTMARSAVLSKVGVSMPTTIIITGYERVVAALVSAALTVFGALYLFGHITLDLSGGGDELLEIIAGIAFVALAGAVFAWGSQAKQAIRGAKWKHVTATYLRASAVTGLIQLSTMIAYLAASIGFSPSIPLTKLVAATALVMFAASIPISLAGWGIREVSAVYALGTIGMPSDVSVVVALLIGFSSIVVMATMALVGSSFVATAHSNTHPVGSATMARLHGTFLDWAVPVFVASTIFFQIYVPVGIGKLNVNLADTVVLFGGALFVRHLMSCDASRSPSRVPRLGILVLLMTATIAVAFVHGWIVDGWTAWASTNRTFGWFVLLAYAGTGALLARQNNTGGFPLLLRTFVIAGLAIATFELMLLLTVALGAPIPEKLLALRIDGFAQNPNAFGFQLLLIIAGIIALRLKGWRQYGALAITFATLYFTASRAAEGTWLVVCAAAIALGYLNSRSLVSSLLATAICIGLLMSIGYAVTALGTASSGHIANHLSPYFATNSYQLMHGDPGHDFTADRWISDIGGIHMFLAHPIFGAGLGAFVATVERQRHEFLIIHSTPIWLLAETGIVGFTIFVMPYCYVLYREIRASLAGHVDSARILLVLSLIAFGVMSQAHDLMYQRPFWFLLGAAIFSAAPVTQRDSQSSRVAATVDNAVTAV